MQLQTTIQMRLLMYSNQSVNTGALLNCSATTYQINFIVKEAIEKSYYNKKLNLYRTDYFFLKDHTKFKMLWNKNYDHFLKKVKQTAMKYLILYPIQKGTA